IAEVLLRHRNTSPREARAQAIEMLRRVRIPSPERRADDYPHQLSGGMRQRVMIAMALACNPKLLIADEPTTALDVTIQAQILELMRALRAELGTAIILITHDLGVIAELADDVIVMYAGQVIERCAAERLVKHFPVRSGLFGRARGAVQAVDDISFELYPGETLALVGESGCGKSTAGKLLLRLIEPTSGTVYFQGKNLLSLREREMRSL